MSTQHHLLQKLKCLHSGQRAVERLTFSWVENHWDGTFWNHWYKNGENKSSIITSVTWIFPNCPKTGKRDGNNGKMPLAQPRVQPPEKCHKISHVYVFCSLRVHQPPWRCMLRKVMYTFMIMLCDCIVKCHWYVSRNSGKNLFSRFPNLPVPYVLWLSTSTNISSILCTFPLEVFSGNDCNSFSYLVLAQIFRSPPSIYRTF